MRVPFFSINIPAYNCEDLILSAFESIATQTFEDWEVVVVDDGSTDRTAEICASQKIIPHDKYTFVKASHMAQYSTRARLHASSQGKIIISLDADDCLIGDNALLNIYNALSETKADVLLFNATRNLDSLHTFADYSNLSKHNGLVNVEDAVYMLCSSVNLNNICLKAYRRDLIKFEYLSRETQYYEDRLQSAELLCASKVIALLDKPLYYYRLNRKSITNEHFEFACIEDFIFVEKIVDSMFPHFCKDSIARNIYLAKTISDCLHRLYKSYPSKKKRLVLYNSIYEKCFSLSIFPRHLSNTRIDFLITYNLFAEKKFSQLDAWLKIRETLNSCQKALTRG